MSLMLFRKVLLELDDNALASALQSIGSAIVTPGAFQSKAEGIVPQKFKSIILTSLTAKQPKVYTPKEIKGMFKTPEDIEEAIKGLKVGPANLKKFMNQFMSGLKASKSSAVAKLAARANKSIEAFADTYALAHQADHWYQLNVAVFDDSLIHKGAALNLMNVTEGQSWVKEILRRIEAMTSEAEAEGLISTFFGIMSELSRRYEALINQFNAALNKNAPPEVIPSPPPAQASSSAPTPPTQAAAPQTPTPPVGPGNNLDPHGEILKNLTSYFSGDDTKTPAQQLFFAKSWVAWANQKNELKGLSTAKVEKAIRIEIGHQRRKKNK